MYCIIIIYLLLNTATNIHKIYEIAICININFKTTQLQ